MSQMKLKYHNVRTRGYDSAREAERARQLRLLQKAGAISELQEQVRFELIPAIWLTPNGEKVELWENRCFRRSVFCAPEENQEQEKVNRKGWKCLQRKCEYVADFVYRDGHGRIVVEDTKGFRTDVYKIKKKLMLYVYGIEIKEA